MIFHVIGKLALEKGIHGVGLATTFAQKHGKGLMSEMRRAACCDGLLKLGTCPKSNSWQGQGTAAFFHLSTS
jgi:hypothetical protein